jgi:hypothetical protein
MGRAATPDQAINASPGEHRRQPHQGNTPTGMDRHRLSTQFTARRSQSVDIAVACILSIVLLFFMPACTSPRGGKTVAGNVIPPLTGLPGRIAILVVKAEDPLLREDSALESVYARLELTTGQMLRQTKSAIVERMDLRSIRAEQWWQYRSDVSEKSLVPLGQLLGADLLFLYKVTVPSYRNRLFARFDGDASVVAVAAKVLRVKTGEVIWSHISTGRMTASKDTGVEEYNRGLLGVLDRAADAMLVAVQDGIVAAALENGNPE